MIKIVSVLIVLIALYFGLILLLYLKQKDFIFYPTKLNQNYNFSQFTNFEELYFAKNEATIHAIHFKTENPKGIVLYFHGNAGAVDKWGYAASDFTSRNYEVLMQDFRSYGKSTGTLSEENMNEDALMIYNKLIEKYSPSKIIIYGRSLGSGVACELSTKVDSKLVILETPYSSIDAVAKRGFFFLPVSKLLKFHFYNDQKIKKLKAPVHIIHGTEDELIPYPQAVKLAEIYGDHSILTTIEGGGHNNLSSFDLFQKTLDELLR
jgi:pimeloyl-ACP methyl ester carboxylesterase